MKQSYKEIPEKRLTLACRCLLIDRKLFHAEFATKVVKITSQNPVKLSIFLKVNLNTVDVTDAQSDTHRGRWFSVSRHSK